MNDTPITLSALVRLERQHEAIATLIDGLAEAELARRPASGAWSIAEQLAHLGRYQEVFPVRIARMLAEPTPAFERYRAEADEGFARWTAMAPLTIPAAIGEGRAAIVSLVCGLTPEQTARAGSHPLFGVITIPYWIEFFLLHEAHHLYAVMKLRGEILRGGRGEVRITR